MRAGNHSDRVAEVPLPDVNRVHRGPEAPLRILRALFNPQVVEDNVTPWCPRGSRRSRSSSAARARAEDDGAEGLFAALFGTTAKPKKKAKPAPAMAPTA